MKRLCGGSRAEPKTPVRERNLNKVKKSKLSEAIIKLKE
jgi:hypothetical protein